jgi:hypothetical protein
LAFGYKSSISLAKASSVRFLTYAGFSASVRAGAM